MEVGNQLLCIFCEKDDFCKAFDGYMKHKLLTGSSAGQCGPKGGLFISESMTILLMFHRVRFRDFKTFYVGFFRALLAWLFPQSTQLLSLDYAHETCHCSDDTLYSTP